MRRQKRTAQKLSRKAGLYLVAAFIAMVVIGIAAYLVRARYGLHLHRGRERHR